MNYDGDADYFEETVTEAGSSIYDDDNEGQEGEEEERSDSRSDRSYDDDAGDGDRPQHGRVADSAGTGGSSSVAAVG